MHIALLTESYRIGDSLGCPYPSQFQITRITLQSIAKVTIVKEKKTATVMLQLVCTIHTYMYKFMYVCIIHTCTCIM